MCEYACLRACMCDFNFKSVQRLCGSVFNVVMQIADFGMSRDLIYESYYISHGGMIPVKWTAPEVNF